MQNTSLKPKHLLLGGLVIAGILAVCIVFFTALKQKTTSPTNQSESNQPVDVARNNEPTENKSPEPNSTRKTNVVKQDSVDAYPESLQPLVKEIFAMRAQKMQLEKVATDLEGERDELMNTYTEKYHRVKDLSDKLSKAKMRVAEVEEKLRPLESELIDRMQSEKSKGRNFV